nr:MAG TPA: hypothetical protein [Caudoviricetes sp.]
MLYYNNFFCLSTLKLYFFKHFIDFFTGRLYIIEEHSTKGV